MNCALPGSATAPGPGRSAAASTVALNAGGMQKVLTRVEVRAVPSLRHAFAGVPISVMVRAGPWPNAPDVRCRHLVNGDVVHWESAVQATAGGPWKVGLNCWPQNPQNTKGCAERSVEVSDCAPVVRAKGIGKLPMNAAVAGGQSWLVGYAPPRLAESAGVQGCPAFGPAVQVAGVPVQRGHGTRPSVGPVR